MAEVTDTTILALLLLQSVLMLVFFAMLAIVLWLNRCRMAYLRLEKIANLTLGELSAYRLMAVMGYPCGSDPRGTVELVVYSSTPLAKESSVPLFVETLRAHSSRYKSVEPSSS